MEGRIGHVLRAGAAAVGVSAGLMVLASTAQTPDGFIHASLGGPLDLFSGSSTEVLAIGDGPTDAADLAALLNTPTEDFTASPDSPYRMAYEAGTTPNLSAPKLIPAADPPSALTTKQSLAQISKPIVDSQGRVDCTGSVSCSFDPATKITTVTYPDGVIAVVQKVNDMTVVAYQTLAENLRSQIQALLPPAPTQAPSPMASVPAPVQTPVPSAAPVLPPPVAVDTAVPAVDPGPPAPEPVLVDPTGPGTGPRINVTRPPMDFTPGRDSFPTLPNEGNSSAPKLPNLNGFRDALDSVADAVNDAVDKVGKAIGAGAADRPSTTDKPSSPDQP